MTDAGDPASIPPAARRPGAGWGLPAAVFCLVFILAFSGALFTAARSKPAARSLAGRPLFAALRAEWGSPPLYLATATVQHEVSGPAVPGAEILPEFSSMVAAMESRELAAHMVRKTMADRGIATESVPPAELEFAVNAIRAAVAVDADEARRTISASYRSTSPEGAESAANLLAEQFVAHPEMLFADPKMRAAASLQSALVRAREEIAQREDELQNLAGAGAASSPGLALQRAEREGRLEAAEMAYMQLLDSISTLGDIVYEEPRLVIIERATLPAQPLAPPLLRALQLSLGAGLGAGLLAALATWSARRFAARRRA